MTNTKVAMTLSNSIIGVSILAMPYCMKTCGLILGTLLLILNSLLTRFTCHLLLKSAVVSRKMTFEFIANHTFGQIGKLAAELNIIGFMLGILISFFVVIGDLAPTFTAEVFQIENTPSLRFIILVCFGIGAALPLAMLREIDSLSHISMLSILFYITLALKTIIEAMPVLIVDEWSNNINLWRPSGILQSLPIFALALSCQTQIFAIYESLPEPSLKQMNSVVKLSINLCTGLYVVVGIFGYVANCDKDFTGNILVHFTPGLFTEAIKLLFVLAVALSFPLVIFPCRTSIHSLLFKGNSASFEVSGNYIPEPRFKTITFVIVFATLIIGILCPNIEIVLGFVGSTIGILTCIIFPALMFVQLVSKHTFEKWGAQMVLVIGIVLLASCTCARLSSLAISDDEVNSKSEVISHIEKTDDLPDVSLIILKSSMVPLSQKVEENLLSKQAVTNRPTKSITLPLQPVEPIPRENIVKDTASIVPASIEDGHKRQEPPVPQEPDEQQKEDNKFKDMVLGIIDKRIEVKTNEANQRLDENVKGPAAGIAKILEDNSKALQHQEEILRQLEVQQKEQKQLLEAQREILKELKAHEKSHDNPAEENAFQETHKVELTTPLQKPPSVKPNEFLEDKKKLILENSLFSEMSHNRSLPLGLDVVIKKSSVEVQNNYLKTSIQINTKENQNNSGKIFAFLQRNDSVVFEKSNGAVLNQFLKSKRKLITNRIYNQPYDERQLKNAENVSAPDFVS